MLARPADARSRSIRGGALVRRFIAPIAAAAALVPAAVQAQAGPPFLTNDPGTPGPANWEINVGSAQTVSRGGASYQAPQLDLNFGLGDRIQLTYEIPYLVDTPDSGPRQSGWSNAFPGLKWRFLDQGEEGWQVSAFPQVETAASEHAEERGLAVPGPRFLQPRRAAVCAPRSRRTIQALARFHCAFHGGAQRERHRRRSAGIQRLLRHPDPLEPLRAQACHRVTRGAPLRGASHSFPMMRAMSRELPLAGVESPPAPRTCRVPSGSDFAVQRIHNSESGAIRRGAASKR